MFEFLPEVSPTQAETRRAAVPAAAAEAPLPPALEAQQPAASAPPAASDAIFCANICEAGEATTAASGAVAAASFLASGRRQKRKTPARDHAVRHEAAPLSGPVTAARLKEAITSWGDLPEARRRALLTAVRHAEHILSVGRDKLQGVVPWSCAGLNRVLWAQAPRCYGLSVNRRGIRTPFWG